MATDGTGTLFLTGFPGFLGTRLVARLLEERPGQRAIALVQDRFVDLARQRVDELADRHPATAGRIEIVVGDITRPGLALSDADRERVSEVSEVHHLAAVYDLAVSRQVGQAVNVDGTRHVLDWMETLARTPRLHYVSTGYVAGTHEGQFLEDDLDVGQEFKNFYEWSKHEAERLVRERTDRIETTIYRPVIVVGDSRTGETQKFDGPYFAMLAMMRMPRYFFMPRPGDGSTPMYIVPIDFVIESIVALVDLPEAAGKTYHLTPEHGIPVQEFLELAADKLGRKLLFVPMSLRLSRALMRIPGAHLIYPFPAQALDYFVATPRFDNRNFRAALGAVGITCPSLESYLDVMVSYTTAHRERGPGEAMV